METTRPVHFSEHLWSEQTAIVLAVLAGLEDGRLSVTIRARSFTGARFMQVHSMACSTTLLIDPVFLSPFNSHARMYREKSSSTEIR